jgi:hypothetical protein
MINLVSGRVTCGSMVLEPATRIEELLSLPGVETVLSVASATHCALGAHECDGHHWGMRAVFQGQRLDKVLMQILDSDEFEWSANHAELRQKMRENFVESLCRVAPPGQRYRHNFAWGSIESTLDRRGIHALIVVSYKQQLQ